MPQLDTSTFASQILWLIIAFAVLYFLLKRKVLPMMAETLEKRQQAISRDLERAETLQQEAEGILADYERTMTEARDRARDTVRQAHEASAADAAEQERKQAEKLAKSIGDAEKRIAKARDEAVAGVEEAVAEVAASLVEEISGKKPTKKQIDDAAKSAQAPA